MNSQVFVPVTDDIIYNHPELIEGPLIPYFAGMECQNWLTIEINPDESKPLALSNSKLPNGKLPNGKLPNGKLSNSKLSNSKLSNSKQGSGLRLAYSAQKNTRKNFS